MRRIYVFQFTLLLLFASSVNAQTGFTLGVRGGFTVSKPRAYASAQVLKFDNDAEIQRPEFDNVGPHIGIINRYDFEKWYLFSEIDLTVTSNRFYVKTSKIGYDHFGTPTKFNGGIGGGIKPLPWLRLYGSLNAALYKNNFLNSYFYDSYRSTLQELERKPNDPFSIEKVKIDEATIAYGDAVNKQHLFGKIGIGFDTQGFMFDLVYQRSLTPYMSDINFNNQIIPFRLNYGFWNLSVAYRLFPISKFLTAPRKNKIVEAQKSAVPFYQNEYSFAFGKEGEDIGSANVYENTYTRYLTPVFGLTVGVSAMKQTLSTGNAGSLSTPAIARERYFSGFVEAKLRLLYTAKHRIGIAGGFNLSKRKGVYGLGGGTTTDAQGNPVTFVFIKPINESTKKGLQVTADYQYILTKRIAIGAWGRLNNEGYQNPFAQFGIKTSLLF